MTSAPRKERSTMKRKFWYAVVAGAGAAILLTASLGNASQPCRTARGDSPVAKACAEGGVVRAKESMRAMVKQGRAAGTRFMCDDCHNDDEHYDQLAPDAKQKFAKLLSLLGKS
jgi:hypothetical protein